MTRPYLEYKYLWPPRPEKKIPTSGLGFYEREGWVAQTKKNGTCTVIFSRGDEVIFRTRHNEEHKLWTPTKEHLNFFSGQENWNVYVAELLHSKVTGGPKNELYIFDVLVSNGTYLTGVTFEERVRLLNEQWDGDDEDDQVRISPKICLAKNFVGSFSQRFNSLKTEDEGLVLKNPKAKLLPCFKPNSNAGWMVKCRIPHKNYSF